MSHTSTASNGVGARLLDKLGLPAPPFLGFVGVLLFMIGDGVESNYLSPFLVDQEGFGEQAAAITISLYGVFVTIGSWLAGALSAVLGPRKVMALVFLGTMTRRENLHHPTGVAFVCSMPLRDLRQGRPAGRERRGPDAYSKPCPGVADVHTRSG